MAQSFPPASRQHQLKPSRKNQEISFCSSEHASSPKLSRGDNFDGRPRRKIAPGCCTDRSSEKASLNPRFLPGCSQEFRNRWFPFRCIADLFQKRIARSAAFNEVGQVTLLWQARQDHDADGSSQSVKRTGYFLRMVISRRIVVRENQDVFPAQGFRMIRTKTVDAARRSCRQPKLCTCICCFLALDIRNCLFILNFAKAIQRRLQGSESVNPPIVFPSLLGEIFFLSIPSRLETELSSEEASVRIRVCVRVYGFAILVPLARMCRPIQQPAFFQPRGHLGLISRMEARNKGRQGPGGPLRIAGETAPNVLLGVDFQRRMRITIAVALRARAAIKYFRTFAL
jgi:hypothetical protein